MSGRPLRGGPSVVVSHPGVQQSYETVAGLQAAGMLSRFVTSMYWRGKSEEARAPWTWLPPAARAQAVAALRRRWHASIDKRNVQTIGAPFMTMRTAAAALDAVGLGRWHGVEQLGDAGFDRLVARAFPRLNLTQVHAFEGAALHTLRAARRRGLRTVLDVPSAHEFNVAVAVSEAEATGRRPPRRFGSSARVREERRLADAIVSPSGYVSRCLLTNGVDAKRIVQVPFGADPEVFAPRARRAKDGKFVLLDVGSINHRKGTRYLLQAWRELALPDAELVLAGEPDDAGRELLRHYHGLYRHLGYVSWRTLPDLFRSATAFVLPSLAEGSALVTYMAMASALPVIVTDEAGSVAADGREGWIVPSRDVGALKERIVRLYERRAEAEELGAAGRRVIQTRYTWQHYHRRLAAMHQALYEGADLVDAIASVPGGPTLAGALAAA